jgi:hypothetical protein
MNRPLRKAFSSPVLAVALTVALIIAALFPSPTSAYIDPGNGSYLFQILLGVFLTAAVTLRNMWARILSVFKALLDRLFTR